MTLCTQVFVMSECDPHDVFAECRGLLDAPTNLPSVDKPSSWSDGEWDLRNPGGVGLDAWLWVHYRPGAMRRPDAEVHNEDCEPDCDGRHHEPPHWFDVTFDTAYSYRDQEGRGCGALHASLVARLGMWLDERNVRWAWQNEFTGEIHVGDRYERLYDLFDGGDNAREWFEEIVKPAIERGFGVT